MDILDGVPEEIWMLIFSFLMNLVDLPLVAQTCRLFRRLAEDASLWRTMNFEKIRLRAQFHHQPKTNEIVDSLLTRHRSAIYSLTSQFKLLPVFTSGAPEALRGFGLQTLELFQLLNLSNLANIVSSCRALRCFRFLLDAGTNATVTETVNQAFVILGGAPTLRELCVRAWAELTVDTIDPAASAIQALVEGCTELTHLALFHISIDHRAWQQLARLKHLRILEAPLQHIVHDLSVSVLDALRSFANRDGSADFPALQQVINWGPSAPYWGDASPLPPLQCLRVHVTYGYEHDLDVTRKWAPHVQELQLGPDLTTDIVLPSTYTAFAEYDPMSVVDTFADVRTRWPEAKVVRHVCVTHEQLVTLIATPDTWRGLTSVGVRLSEYRSLATLSVSPLAGLVTALSLLEESFRSDAQVEVIAAALARFPRLAEIELPLTREALLNDVTALVDAVPSAIAVSLRIILVPADFVPYAKDEETRKRTSETASGLPREKIALVHLPRALETTLHRRRPRCSVQVCYSERPFYTTHPAVACIA